MMNNIEEMKGFVGEVLTAAINPKQTNEKPKK